MERACCGVIVAAGSSTRMGCAKQFLPLLGEPAIAWTLRAFQNAGSIASLVLVIREEDGEAMREIAARCGFQSVHYFSRRFRQLTHMSPSEYARSVRMLLEFSGSADDSANNL